MCQAFKEKKNWLADDDPVVLLCTILKAQRENKKIKKEKKKRKKKKRKRKKKSPNKPVLMQAWHQLHFMVLASVCSSNS